MANFPWCCSMGTSAIKGDYSVLRATNTKWSPMACEGCSVKFNLLRRKKTCCSCGHNFCIPCIKQLKSTDRQIRCLKCKVLTSVPLDRNAITALRIRDLLWFLDVHQIPSQGCKEKNDLVELVMHHGSLHNASSAYPQNYERHTTITERPELNRSPTSDRTTSAELESVESSPLFTHRDTEAASTSHSSIPGAIRTESPYQERESEEGFVIVNSESETETVASEPRMSSESSKTPPSSERFTPLSVDDIKSLEHISEMTVRQLKLILTRNYVGYKGCCEKQELQNRVRQLWEQKQESKDVAAITDENLCKICFEAPINSVLLDCGHVVSCTECGKRLHECPICRQYVVRVVHIFKA